MVFYEYKRTSGVTLALHLPCYMRFFLLIAYLISSNSTMKVITSSATLLLLVMCEEL